MFSSQSGAVLCLIIFIAALSPAIVTEESALGFLQPLFCSAGRSSPALLFILINDLCFVPDPAPVSCSLRSCHHCVGANLDVNGSAGETDGRVCYVQVRDETLKLQPKDKNTATAVVFCLFCSFLY